ncbi:50S ribosomal protein L22, partial [Candidatus Hydrogenedentota bacterium]
MQATAKGKWVRVPPRKARLVIDLIRGKKVDEALVALSAVTRNAARIIEKILKSAVA